MPTPPKLPPESSPNRLRLAGGDKTEAHHKLNVLIARVELVHSQLGSIAVVAGYNRQTLDTLVPLVREIRDEMRRLRAIAFGAGISGGLLVLLAMALL